MVGWHHPLNGHEFEQAPGDGEGQGGLGCCSPWGRKESDMTEQLNSNNRWGKKGVPAAASGQKPTCHCRRCKRQGSIPGSGRAPGGGHGNSLQYSCLEKPMATHSSILAWRSPWTEEPGGLQSMGSQRVRHN